MPAHPDRVRRNYHTIILQEQNVPALAEQQILIRISRESIASAMSRREIEMTLWRSLQREIVCQYRGGR